MGARLALVAHRPHASPRGACFAGLPGTALAKASISIAFTASVLRVLLAVSWRDGCPWLPWGASAPGTAGAIAGARRHCVEENGQSLCPG